MYFIAGMVPPDTEERATTQSSNVLPSSSFTAFRKDRTPKSKVAAL